jgi:predicted aspartyl protease
MLKLMEKATMGKVLVQATLESLDDLYEVSQGRLPESKVRRLDVSQAVADTGAFKLSLPKRLIDQLGLRAVGKRSAHTTNGIVERTQYSVVRLTVQGRAVSCDVSELPDDCPVLIGQLPLEDLDFVVDPKGQRLIGNPDHGGEWMIDEF